MTQRVTHWLRENRASRVPRRLVCFDSEARIDRDGYTESHSFRLGSLCFDLLDAQGNPTKTVEPRTYDDAAELWAAIVACTAQSHRTVAFAHKLDYDLRLTGALEHLPALGFALKGIGLNSHSTWARLSDGKRTLWLCDSLSFLPAPMERLAGLLKRPALPLPRQSSSREAWVARCEQDVSNLRAAVLHLLRLLVEEDWGDFRLTGSAQATACFRHRFLRPRSLLVHSDPVALAAERRAAFAGRCEVWKHGRQGGPIFEYDFTSAYASIAHSHDLPSRLWGEHTVLPPGRLELVRQSQSALCDVTVRTETATVPSDFEGRIVWPVGEFKTTLWDCELDLLTSEGGTYTVERLWLYDRGPVLRDWADYVLRALRGYPPGDDPIAALVIKHWSRALIGRFGLRYPSIEEWGLDTRSELSLQPVLDVAAGLVTNHLQVGRQIFEQTGIVESPNSIPMLMAWVMAKSRVWLWGLMRRAGFANVLYVDTDGLLVNAEGAERLDALIAIGTIPGLRRKGRWARADIRSPRNLDTGDERRIAGVPRKAARIRPSVYQAEVWESLPAALRRQRAQTVVVSERMFTVRDRDPRRIHLPRGATQAIRLTIDPSTGANSLDDSSSLATSSAA